MEKTIDICEECHQEFGFSGKDDNGYNCTCVHCGNNSYTEETVECEICGAAATHFCECEECLRPDEGLYGRWLCDECGLLYKDEEPSWTDDDCPKCGARFVAEDQIGRYCAVTGCGWTDYKLKDYGWTETDTPNRFKPPEFLTNTERR